MQHILVYADSLSWGIVPTTRQRLPFDQRWPGVMENLLNQSGTSVRVIEDCLNGRRTVWDDPFKPGRKGLDGLAREEMAWSDSLSVSRFTLRWRWSCCCWAQMISSRCTRITPGILRRE